MPYSSIADLPESVKNVLSEDEQERFIAAFNAAYKEGKDEESCFKIAWAAAREENRMEGEREASLPLDRTSGSAVYIIGNTSTESFYNPANWTLVPNNLTFTTSSGPREAEKPRTRMLNVSLADYSKFQELDGGLLVKDVKLLAEGTWTDSNVQTPLHYPAATLQKDAGNWLNRSLWVRHAGKAPRAITDKVGSVKSPHYDPQERAIMGDLYFHCRTQMSKDAAELVRCGEINAVSVEHGGEERFNAVSKEYDATALAFYGCALVDMGACEVCKIRHDEKVQSAPADSNAPQIAQELEKAPQEKESVTMDDECKKAFADLAGRIKALEDKMAPPEEKKEEPKKEAEKPAPAPVVDIGAEIAKALEPISLRLNALEKKPEPKSLQPKVEDQKELSPAPVKVRARTMTQGDF